MICSAALQRTGGMENFYIFCSKGKKCVQKLCQISKNINFLVWVVAQYRFLVLPCGRQEEGKFATFASSKSGKSTFIITPNTVSSRGLSAVLITHLIFRIFENTAPFFIGILRMRYSPSRGRGGLWKRYSLLTVLDCPPRISLLYQFFAVVLSMEKR